MKVLVLFAKGYEEIEALTPINFFYRAGIDCFSVSLNNTVTVRGSHNISIQCTMKYNTFEKTLTKNDIIILPGGLPGSENLAKNKKLSETLLKHNKNNGLIAAICAAPAYTLAPLGILKGKKYTCFPKVIKQIQTIDPTARYVDEAVVKDKNIITSQGMGTVALLSLKIISIIKGKALAHSLFKNTLQHAPKNFKL